MFSSSIRFVRPRLSRWPVYLIVAGALLTVGNELLADASMTSRLHALEQRQTVSQAEPSLLLQRALLLEKQGESDAASDLIREVKVSWPNLNTSFYEGLLVFERREYAAARDHFSEGLAADLEHFWGLYYRAQSSAALDDLGRAVHDYEQMLLLRSDLSPGFYLTLVDWLVAGDEQGVERALSVLDKRMEEVGYLSVLLQRSIDLEVMRGDINGAIDRTAYFDSRIRATPEWKARLAELLVQNERYAEAAAYLHVARQQIAGMRFTPARRETLTKIAELDSLVSSSNSMSDEGATPRLALSETHRDTNVSLP